MEDHQHHPCTPALPAAPPTQPAAPVAQPPAPPAQPAPPPVKPGLVPQSNWSHFKLESAGKPDKDAEVHLLRTNNWMETHGFPEGVKGQRFCSTLVGEARLLYESPRSIALDWNGLQAQFRLQFSKIGKSREQLFHMWRSIHFDKKTETLDSYVTHIRQVSFLLGYGKPQV